MTEISYEETQQIEQELKRFILRHAWEVKIKSICTSIVGDSSLSVPAMRFPKISRAVYGSCGSA